MRDHIRFLLGTEVRVLRSIDPTQTVMRWLREDAFRRGTKEGCAEGDCGACTVVIGRLNSAGEIRYQPVNSCIQFVGTLDGCQLLTVEDLAADDGTLHPIQTAMVDQHGSQCGFCTPGFIMSMAAIWLNGEVLDRQGIEDALAGNLCRCTGYGPIIAAAETIAAMPKHAPDPSIKAKLTAWQDGDDIAAGSANRFFHAPASLESLAQIANDDPDGTILAGSTDVGLWVTKQNRKLNPVIWLGRVGALQQIIDGDVIEIGAGVDYERAVAVITQHYPGAAEMFRRLGSRQIREAGTIGGNIANGSPIGDSPPMLIAAGCRIELRHGDRVRTLPLEEFFIDYGKQDRAPGEVLTKILLDKPKPGGLFKVYKISKRFDQDISAVCAAFNIQVEENKVVAARIAMGGMAAIPKRAKAAEQALTGKPWDENSVRAAMAAMDDDFTPISDMRASALYRQRVAQNLLLRCYLDAQEPVELTGPARLAHG